MRNSRAMQDAGFSPADAQKGWRNVSRHPCGNDRQLREVYALLSGTKPWQQISNIGVDRFDQKSSDPLGPIHVSMRITQRGFYRHPHQG